MRSIAKFSNEEDARRFSFFLKKEGIHNELEVEGSSFSLWVEDEDDLLRAKSFFEEWKKGTLQLPEVIVENPPPSVESHEEEELSEEEADDDEEAPLEEDSLEEMEVTKAPPPLERRKRFVITFIFFLACLCFFFWNGLEMLDWQEPSKGIFLVTKIQNLLLYDDPSALRNVNQYLIENPYDPSKNFDEQTEKMQEILKKREEIPIWRGFASLLDKKSQQYSLASPTFEKIRQGQIWRLISPSFLHENFLHILFNILWLWVLGKQVETRLSKTKYCLLVFLLGLATNTMQYLMSGPFFLGYSGVIMGLVGFIWMRQKIAPWEGYPLSKTTLLFVAFFVLALFAFQFFSFGLEIVGIHLLSSNIANTAHVSGGILGLLLGRLSFFSRRAS